MSSDIADDPRPETNMSKTFLRKRQLAQRYGDVTLRSIERAVEAGRIPAPEYPCGEHTPLWDLEKLETNERAAVIRSGRQIAHDEDAVAS
jgi:hypothetical protein